MRETAVDILTKTFGENPSVLNSISNRGLKSQRIKHLSIYAYKTAKLRNGVYLSSDKNGCAIAYKYNVRKEGLKDYFNQIALIINAIGIKKLGQTLKLEKQHKRIRPADGEYIYFWFLGVKHEGRSGLKAFIELRNLIFQQSEEQQLPILLETSVEKNQRVYSLMGFSTYYEGQLPDGKTLYYMRREPNGTH